MPGTHCPPDLGNELFAQVAADVDVDLHERLRDIRYQWEHRVRPDHPAKQAMAAAGVDYMRTGFALFSLCLPAGCVFAGRPPATLHLVGAYCQSRAQGRGSGALAAGCPEAVGWPSTWSTGSAQARGQAQARA